jgi:drug/metabolite transporter (DMT)-like permease
MPDDPLMATGMEMAFGGAALCIVGLALGELSGFHLSDVASASAIGWIWLVVPGSLIGFTAYSYALRNLPTTTVATYAYANPVVAVALGSILGDQTLTGGLVMGGMAVVAAVAVTLSRRQASPVDALIEADASVEVA